MALVDVPAIIGSAVLCGTQKGRDIAVEGVESRKRRAARKAGVALGSAD